MDYIWGQSISLSLPGGEGLDGGSLGWRGGSWMTIPGCYIFMNDSFFSRSETFFEIKGVHSFFNVAIQDCFMAGVGT